MAPDETHEERGPSALEGFHREVACWPHGEPLPEFFWRDDDVTRVVPSLESFLQLSDRRNIPIAFAAIPTQLTSGAAQAIRASKLCRIAAHGFTHTSHATADQPDNEYPAGRASATVLRELQEGQKLIKEKARDRYLSMFVPPWGRFDVSYDALLARAGIVSYSGSATAARYSVPVQMDCHILTEHGKAALALDFVLRRITRHLEVRRSGRLPRLMPIGLMTHHRTFGSELEVALDEILEIIQAAGFRFVDFELIDRVAARAEAGQAAPLAQSTKTWGGKDGLRLPQPGEPDLSFAELLLRKTLPQPDEGFVGLERVLLEIAMASPISVLRYTHLKDAVSALPPGARVLSAGCGKALAEVALAISNPDVSWLAVDIDPTRYQHAASIARNADVPNVRFAQADLDQAGGWDFGQVDAIIVSEVAMYLQQPAKTFAALRAHLNPSGTLTCIEPFLTDGDPTLLEKLRQHTASLHGGFTHEQMRTLVAGMEVLSLCNCYWHAPDQLLKMLWDQMSATESWGLVDLMFAMAQLDLSDTMATHRREATAVKIVARATTLP
ncbi:MAG: methyltransferase [Myxococcales bacterium]